MERVSGLSENSKKVTHNKGRERLLQGKSSAVMKKQKINVDKPLLIKQQRLQRIRKAWLKPSLRGLGKSVKKSQTTFQEHHPFVLIKLQSTKYVSYNTVGIQLCYVIKYYTTFNYMFRPLYLAIIRFCT